MPCDLVVELFANGDFINIFSLFSFRHALGLGIKEKTASWLYCRQFHSYLYYVFVQILVEVKQEECSLMF